MNLFLKGKKKRDIFPHEFTVERNRGRAIEREGALKERLTHGFFASSDFSGRFNLEAFYILHGQVRDFY